MEFWQSLLLVIVPSVITAIVTLRISRKSQLNSITKAIDELSRKLGEFNDVPLEHQLGVGIKNDNIQSLTKQIGIGKDEKSLTGQHKDIIDLITSDKDARAEALKKFSKKQKKILETTEEFKLFIEDWEKKTAEYNELTAEAERLREQNEEMKACIIEKEAEIKKLTEYAQTPELYCSDEEDEDELER